MRHAIRGLDRDTCWRSDAGGGAPRVGLGRLEEMGEKAFVSSLTALLAEVLYRQECHDEAKTSSTVARRRRRPTISRHRSRGGRFGRRSWRPPVAWRMRRHLPVAPCPSLGRRTEATITRLPALRSARSWAPAGDHRRQRRQSERRSPCTLQRETRRSGGRACAA